MMLPTGVPSAFRIEKYVSVGQIPRTSAIARPGVTSMVASKDGCFRTNAPRAGLLFTATISPMRLRFLKT
jgi:hypothetical protein